jgi:3-phenylpropionate/trans-cinnamate dioxygenase ferredoxin subunit
MGCLKGATVKCPLHGSYFDLTSGIALNEPAEDPIRVYKTIIENNHLYINE